MRYHAANWAFNGIASLFFVGAVFTAHTIAVPIRKLGYVCHAPSPSPANPPPSVSGFAPSSTLDLDIEGSSLNTVSSVGPYAESSIGGGNAVFLGTGGSSVTATDLAVPLDGIHWLHERTYTSLNDSAPNWHGESWWGNEMMSISVAGTDGVSNVTAEFSPHFPLQFKYVSGAYEAESDNYPYTITFDGGNDEYVIERIDGMKWVFHDAGAPDNEKLKRIEDAYGNDWAFTYSSGQLTDIVVDVVAGNNHKITYSYFTSGDNNGKLQYIKAYKTTTTTDANLIGKVEYAYHDSTSDDYGSTGDLITVIVSQKATNDGDGVLSISDTYRYRYYKGTYNSSTNPGVDHSLRYVLLPENAQRMTDDLGTPESQTNANWDDYANIIYEYDNNDRVRQTQERLPGSGCGCGGASGATTGYTWTTNAGSPDLDTWNIHGVADREDDTRVIFDLNTRYSLLSWVIQDEDDGTPTKELIWHFDYGTSEVTKNRLTAAYNPSACSAYDESSPFAVTFNASNGVIHNFVYYGDGVYGGYLDKIKIRQGVSGTAQVLTSYSRTISERPDLAVRVTHYESIGESDGRKTSLSYTFYDSEKKQIKQIDTTFPSISTAKNGPGTSAVAKKFFDKRTGALRWTLDGEGYVNFVAYDDETGVENLRVIDAATASLMTVIDDNWDGVAHGGLALDDTVPFSRTGTGAALDIDSSATIDWLGRVRKNTDAEGMITYYVYKDDETRVYPAWDTATKKPLLPTQLTLTDEDGRVEQLITLNSSSFVPGVDAGDEPIGTASYSNSAYATWSVTDYNDAGRPSSEKHYHTIPDSGNGTRYTNYYQTEYEYDSMGRLEYLIEDVSDESTYDREQITQHFYDFVGRQIKTSFGVSDNTHDISAGKPSLNVSAEYFFDDPDSDSTPEQGAGDGNLHWMRTWHGIGGNDYNDTEYRYDWRNRRQLTIPPLAPYTLVRYDHMNRVTASATYSATTNLDPGDDPATTENSNRLDLSKTYYDEAGRVYKHETFDDPGDITPADALTSNTYYDRRNLVWADDGANTGIRFTKYDGAGRRTQTLVGTQFDTAKYTSSVPDYPDNDEGIIQQTDITMNEVGNITETTVRGLNHNDTNGMGSSDFIRTYSHTYYDDAHRVTDRVNYGTNNSSGFKDSSTAPTYGSSAPARSDTVLVTSYTYDNEGRLETTTDPRGIDTKSVFDALRRTVAKIEDEGLGKLNRKTEYEYNAQGNLARIIHDPGADNMFASGTWTMAGSDTDQVTEYNYGDSKNSRWVKEIRYPTGDGTVGSTQVDKIVFTYNVDGTVVDRTDQNSTKLTWTYDALRRKTEEEVTTLGTYTGGAAAVDGAARSFTWTYDSEGRSEYLTSHSDTTPDTSTWTDATNQVKFTYNAADRLTKEEQEEDGAVDGSTLAVEYGYGTDYASSGNYNRRNWVEYPDNRKIWNYYAPPTGPTFRETTNSAFNRVGELRADNSGSAGDTIAAYYHNGLGRVVRRTHDEDGAFGNDTRMDLWHGTSGQYDGLDRFGRVIDMKQTDFSGTATDFMRRVYSHDRNGNRTSIEDALYKGESHQYTYDNLNRLALADRGILDSNDAVVVSDAYHDYDMDLLGNFTSTAGGVKINATTSSVTQNVNATNEMTSIDNANPSGPAKVVDEPFDSLGSHWTQDKGTWSVSSGKVQVDTLTSGDAVLLLDPEKGVANYSTNVQFTGSESAGDKAGLIFGHDGNNSYHALVLEKGVGMALYKVTSGSWGSALATSSCSYSLSGSVNNISVAVNGRHVTAMMPDWTQVNTVLCSLNYDSSTEFGAGLTGLYSSKTGVTFPQYNVFESIARDPKTPGIVGVADALISSGKLVVDTVSDQLGVVPVENFTADDYMVQVDAWLGGRDDAVIWVRYTDVDNGYRITIDKNALVTLDVFDKGEKTYLASAIYTGAEPYSVKVKLSGTSIKVWIDGGFDINHTDSTIGAGGVAFSGQWPSFDNLKIGFDENADDDIDDAGDKLILNETFSGTSRTPVYDNAGNLIDDGHFVYVYDAWNRLVEVRSSTDSVTVQTAEFDALGRRIKKIVQNSGDLDATVRYYYDGQKIIETRLGTETTMYQQFVHGTQYIDEIVMVRVKDKGDLYVHQDANWNVIGITDLGGSLVERHTYNPYGSFTIDKLTGFGDRDGDGDVDATDQGTPGVDCTGTVAGACRINDPNFDEVFDSADVALLNALPQGLQRRPGLASSVVQQPFAHQGLLFEPEIGSYQNRARQYYPAVTRFVQRDPAGYGDGLGSYSYIRSMPVMHVDPSGLLVSRVSEGINPIEVYMNIVWVGQDVDSSWRTAAASIDTFWRLSPAGRDYSNSQLQEVGTPCQCPGPSARVYTGNSIFHSPECDQGWEAAGDTGSVTKCMADAREQSGADVVFWLDHDRVNYADGTFSRGFANESGGYAWVWTVPTSWSERIVNHEIGHVMGEDHDHLNGHERHIMAPGGYRLPCHNVSSILNSALGSESYKCCKSGLR